MRTPDRKPRGSALVISVVVVLILSVLAVALIRYASAEVSGAQGGARRAAVVQCAEAARQLLLSKFHAIGVDPTQILALNMPLDGPGGQTLALGGHIDSTPPNGAIGATVGQVAVLPPTAVGPTMLPSSIGQGGSPSGSGPKTYKVVVHCQDGTIGGGRQLEVEFAVHLNSP